MATYVKQQLRQRKQFGNDWKRKLPSHDYVRISVEAKLIFNISCNPIPGQILMDSSDGLVQILPPAGWATGYFGLICFFQFFCHNRLNNKRWYKIDLSGIELYGVIPTIAYL